MAEAAMRGHRMGTAKTAPLASYRSECAAGRAASPSGRNRLINGHFLLSPLLRGSGGSFRVRSNIRDPVEKRAVRFKCGHKTPVRQRFPEIFRWPVAELPPFTND